VAREYRAVAASLQPAYTGVNEGTTLPDLERATSARGIRRTWRRGAARNVIERGRQISPCRIGVGDTDPLGEWGHIKRSNRGRISLSNSTPLVRRGLREALKPREPSR